MALRVLVVDDEPTIRQILTRLLTDEGITVMAAESGMKALKLLEECDGQVDLLITDLIMPGMTGAELATLACARWARLRVLYVTGYGADELERHGITECLYAVQRKPFRPAELLSTIHGLLVA